MYADRELIEARIDREVFERIMPLVHPWRQAMDVVAGPSLDALAPFTVGSPWGAPWETTWFRCRTEVPADWPADARLEAIVDLGFDADSPGFQCEGLVRAADGSPLQGIHPRRQAVPVVPTDGSVSIDIEAASNPMFPQFVVSQRGRLSTTDHDPLYTFHGADLVVVDPAAEALFHDLVVADSLMRALPERSRRRIRLRVAITGALDAIAVGDGIAAARAALADVLAVAAPSDSHHMIASGHAHIDSAWLWPIRETKRKCVRTFTSAVDLMDRDPDYVFVCSQAVQYEWVRESEPTVFERIKAHVAGGQWVPIGGMWVEADMNVPSGESIARQIVIGQRYFEEHFGVRCTEMWIPDVFGYPAGMPQLFAAGGMRRFVTQKMSWNTTNRVPHHTFWWEGLDGTRVLTHFPPVDTYNAEMMPGELVGAEERFNDHAWSDWSLVPYGYGDGGGGPTREMLERARRMADLDGVARIELGTPATMFAHVEDEIARGADVPVWRGELYLETHRGTLTSQLRTKLGNRHAERLLREAELLATAGMVSGDSTAVDAIGDLVPLWRDVLVEQFHDILPGSSIGWVHDDAEATFARVNSDLEGRITAALPPTSLVVNVASTDRREVVVSDGDVDGPGPHQKLADGRTAIVVSAPALGTAPLVAAELPATGDRRPDAVVTTDRSLSNGQLAVSWDAAGRIVSIIDAVAGRELLSSPIVVELAADQPVRYDAWDVESWTIDQGAELPAPDAVDVVDVGPLVGAMAVRHRIGETTVDVRYELRAGSSRLDVIIDLDWQHREHLLTMRFPLDVHADTAACGVQLGAVHRPTNPTTSWDAAKFEVCAHRYVDLAEPGFGVAVLNDGRYGHGVFDGAVRVSLVRGARYPDPEADRGRHTVRLAVFPHAGDRAAVVAEAERLDLPLRLHQPAGDDRDTRCQTPSVTPSVTVNGRGVEVDAVKPADDGSGDVVVRLHEACGDRTSVSVGAPRRIVAAHTCNLLEEPERSFEVSDGIAALVLRPYQLVTLRLTLQAG